MPVAVTVVVPGTMTTPPAVVVVAVTVVVGREVVSVAMAPMVPVQALFSGQQATCPAASAEHTWVFLQQSPGAPIFEHPAYPVAHPDCLLTSSRLSSAMVSFPCAGVSSNGSKNSERSTFGFASAMAGRIKRTAKWFRMFEVGQLVSRRSEGWNAPRARWNVGLVRL